MTQTVSGTLQAVESIQRQRLYWEDFRVGAHFETPARTITEADVVAFAGLTGDYNRLHVDVEHARGTFFGTRVAHGMLVASVSVGLVTRTLVHQLIENTAVGVIENRLRFLKPTLLGDTLHVRVEVTESRPTSKPARGLLVFRRHTLNQRGEIVLEATTTYLINRRGADAAAGEES